MFVCVCVCTETVVPERGVYPGTPGLRVLVGGVPDYYTQHIPGLQGCIRGLRVGQQLLGLAGAAGQGENGRYSIRGGGDSRWDNSYRAWLGLLVREKMLRRQSAIHSVHIIQWHVMLYYS